MKKVFKISQVFCLMVLVLLMATSCNVTDGMFETFTPPVDVTTPEGTTPQEHTHTWGNWIVVVKVKCLEDGLKQRYCTECNYTEAYPINSIGYHTFDHDCDTTCNVCGLVREVPAHIYDNACDTDCNVKGCTYTRATTHKYDNACDTDCNVKGCTYTRTTTHVYSNDCDAGCNVCGAKRSVPGHVYDNACDTNCNVCGAKRSVPPHVYDNACDANCNVCGAKRSVPPHVYDNACDTNCNVCGLLREVPDHVYDNACDTDCNVCRLNREVPAHIYDRDCDATCNVCGYIRQTEHQFDHDCDTTCNVVGCDFSRSIKHNFVNDVCSICGFLNCSVSENHTIVNGKCEVCGFIPVFENASVYDYDNDGQNDIFYFTPIIPEKFTGDDVVHVWAGDYIPELSSSYVSSAYFEPYRHWFCTEGKGEYFTIKVTVEESGIYEMAIHMRMKDDKERGTKYTVNEGTANEYTFETSFQFESEEAAFAARDNNNTMSSYMFGINVNLVQGDNYIKIQNSSKSPKCQHYRDFYFVKVEE